MKKRTWIFCALALQLLTTNALQAESVKGAANKEELLQMPSEELLYTMMTQLKLRLGLTTTQIEALNKLTASYQQKLIGVPEEKISDQLNALIVESGIEWAEVINRHDPMFWLYRARFGLNNPPAPAQFPAWLTRRGQRWYVYLTTSSPEKGTELKRGDEIDFNTGLPLVFGEQKPQALNIKIKSLSWDKPKAIELTLQQKSVNQIFLDLTQSNRKVLATGKTKTGLLMMPAIDLELLRVDVEQALKQFQNSTDQLIVDLRGPYGGGGMTGIELFLDEKGNRVHYKKPLYLLIDRYTSGGRELLASLLQRHASAILFGETTASRTAPVELTELEPGKYILITEHKTKTTEIGPIKPDHPIAESLMFAAGQDKILDGALATISKK
jgi:hypothetical protein